MADINATELTLNEGILIDWTEMDSDTETFDLEEADEKVVILVTNEDSEDLYIEIEAGDFFATGHAPVRQKDSSGDDTSLEATTTGDEANATAAFIVDSAAVKDEDGEVTIAFYVDSGYSTGFGAGAGTIANVYVAVLEL